MEYEELSRAKPSESSESIRERVNKTRLVQQKRFAGTGISCNARITPATIHEFCRMTDEASKVLQMAFDRLKLSGRAYDRIVKVSRTVADLDGDEIISSQHIMEAIHYRTLDREYWHN